MLSPLERIRFLEVTYPAVTHEVDGSINAGSESSSPAIITSSTYPTRLLTSVPSVTVAAVPDVFCPA